MKPPSQTSFRLGTDIHAKIKADAKAGDHNLSSVIRTRLALSFVEYPDFADALRAARLAAARATIKELEPH